MHAESPPAIAMRSAVLEPVPELLDLNEVLIVILVLLRGLVLSPDYIIDVPCLKILSRHLNIVEPRVLEVDQVMAEKVKRLFTRLGVQKALVAVSPGLQSTQVLVVRQRSL